VYLCTLNGFERFVAARGEDSVISQETIQEWLKDRSRSWRSHLVTHRARIVDRFLDWKVKQGALLKNPIGELRKEFEKRTTAPIVRALLSPDFETALEELRPVPRFGSFLGLMMREHLELKKSMGYRYNVHEQWMLRFDRFLQRRPDLSGQPLTVLIQEWTNAGSNAQHALDCHRTGRLLSKALCRMDPTIKTIRWDPRIDRQTRQRLRHPYIFSDQEIRSLLNTALQFPSPQSPLRPQALHMMLVLAYCVGLRIGEIVHLNVGDADLEDRVIEIRGTKFFKSRRLPVSGSVASALRVYLIARERAGAPNEPSAALFWHCHAGGRYSKVMAGKLLVRVFRRAGIKPEKGRIGPRIHDVRHAFVVNRMLAWYREGVNPQSRLPYLATYLGHKDINSTLVYLTITQELLQQASERFRVRGAQVLRASTKGGNA
jgi:site-specific recombinase XerD